MKASSEPAADEERNSARLSLLSFLSVLYLRLPSVRITPGRSPVRPSFFR